MDLPNKNSSCTTCVKKCQHPQTKQKHIDNLAQVAPHGQIVDEHLKEKITLNSIFKFFNLHKRVCMFKKNANAVVFKLTSLASKYSSHNDLHGTGSKKVRS
jgi:hypothetical protein